MYNVLFMSTYRNPLCRVWFIGMDLNKQLSRNIDIQNEVQNFLDIVTSAAQNQNIYGEGMSVSFFKFRFNFGIQKLLHFFVLVVLWLFKVAYNKEQTCGEVTAV